MKQRTTVTALVVLAAFLVLALSMPAASEEKVPKLYIYNTAVELGEFIEGSDIVYEFELRNRGHAELNIINVRPG